MHLKVALAFIPGKQFFFQSALFVENADYSDFFKTTELTDFISIISRSWPALTLTATLLLALSIEVN